jgi:O-antigen ligase
MKKTLKVLDFVLYWAIVMLPFSICIAPGMTFTFMGMMGFSFIVKKAITRTRPFISTPVNLQLLLLIIAALLSFKNTLYFGASVQGVVRLMQNFFLLLICAEEIKDKAHIRRIAIAALCGATLASVDGLWQIFTGKDFIRGFKPILNIGLTRATAAFPNANVFGVYLSAIAPLIIGPALFFYKGKKKIIMLAGCALAVVGIGLTLSRGTAMALYLSVLFLCLMRKSRILSAGLIILLLIFPFIMPQNIRDWAAQVNYNPVRFMLNDDRISVYKNALNMIKHHPVVGVGINTFSKNYLAYKLPEPDWGKTGDSMYAHNHFLQMAGETGLIGLALFFLFLFILFRDNLRTYRLLDDGYLKIVTLSLAACLMAFLVNGLTETSLYYARVAMIFWYLAGVSLSLRKFVAVK